MALSGVHIACGFIGGLGKYQNSSVDLLGKVIWSQTMSAPGTTSQGAASTQTPAYDGDPSFEIYSSTDIYVAVGASPDPTQTTGKASSGSARILIPANTTRNIFCKAGDLLAWTPA
jgi:hypothetical protein